MTEQIMSSDTLSPAKIIEQQAARCVQCALCLPHCPTFQSSNSEPESPRGRIALARAIASGRLNDAAAWRHLDSCLACNACGNMCPSKVDYMQLRKAVYRLDKRPLALPLRPLAWLPDGKAMARTVSARLCWLKTRLATAGK